MELHGGSMVRSQQKAHSRILLGAYFADSNHEQGGPAFSELSLRSLSFAVHITFFAFLNFPVLNHRLWSTTDFF